MLTLPPPPKLLTLQQMARRLRVPTRWLRDEADAGRVPCLRCGRTVLFNPEATEEFLLRRAAQVPGDAGNDDGEVA